MTQPAEVRSRIACLPGWLFLFALFCGYGCERGSPPANEETRLEVPSSIRDKHADLLRQIVSLSTLPDSTGRVAQKLREIIEYHFREEEEYVFPPLALLPSVSRGNIPKDLAAVTKMRDQYRDNNNKLLAEHQMISVYLKELISAATREQHPEAILFEKYLRAHATEEEEILFPAVMLLHEHLRLPATANK